MSPSELEFARHVDALAADPRRRDELLALGRENHEIYAGHGAAAIVRMRGWLLCALARTRVCETAELYALEELDTGIEPYLVAAAARLLRQSDPPRPMFAPIVLQAIANIRYRDAPVAFGRYGDDGLGGEAGTAVEELLTTLAWIGPYARDVLGGIESLHPASGGLPARYRRAVERAIARAKAGKVESARQSRCCCGSEHGQAETVEHADAAMIGSVTFEDHAGAPVGFGEYFQATPSIVCFFYTRCDNPLKCSLTITKLGRVQELLRQRGLERGIRTAAITYDPWVDTPDRMRRYAEGRGVRLSDDHRMLRTIDGMDAVRRYFELGVNYHESIVNRHRLEVYVLAAGGEIVSRFLRVHWDEGAVVDRAMQELASADRAAAPGSR
ncbi:MAG TPA: SCO family protein [Vicinamibacterales bacterium]|nr:SCO family protein [Vicinamibacterales bacterium]